ncbi:hypothetical protein [Desulforamulus ferrireducens]|uniref:hypothetical protein n=1 Tax=Desulforamulus ferrireducens TaxID=1833852 RepID=UPI00135645E8|nr:hypothetical protein [Desulforamulus ferrireducens]
MELIVAATGCGQMTEIKRIFKRYGQVVLGTLDKPKLSPLVSKIKAGEIIPIYFYETG